jgi:hypothetical protein
MNYFFLRCSILVSPFQLSTFPPFTFIIQPHFFLAKNPISIIRYEK